ncbi:MAG: sarcosine oxidase subunit gamma family protein [Pseudomonadota bacterium]
MSDPQTVLNGELVERNRSARIEEMGPTGQITLRGDLSNAAVKKAVKGAVGVDVPTPLTATFNGAGGAVWMSQDEVLLLTEYDRIGAKITKLNKALDNHHVMVLDVSDARAVIRVTGAGARELMAKGAPLDVSDAAFPVGTARRTHFAEIAVGIWRREEEVWEIVCFQSYAQHLFSWLKASSVTGASVGYF